jgi:predicted GNAT superfamily acetyltransferase
MLGIVGTVTELVAPLPHMGVVDIALATSQDDARAATQVLAEIWSADRVRPLSPELAWALVHAGNYVAVARCDDAVIGAAIAFRGYDEAGAHLHSHIAGVLPAHQGSSIGFALKQHQRQWALAQGIDRITWTFDPLVARNAYFNVVKLGTTIASYYPDFYGPLADDINAGDESDRCLASWQLDGERAVRAAAGDVTAVTVAEMRARGAIDLLTEGAAGEPVSAAAAGLDGAPVLCQLPRDIVTLRSTAPGVARQWRLAVRSVLAPALRGGREVSAVTRDGWLIVTPTPAPNQVPTHQRR